MAGRITKNELNQSLKNEIESKASQLDLEGVNTNLQEFAGETSSQLAQDALNLQNHVTQKFTNVGLITEPWNQTTKTSVILGYRPKSLILNSVIQNTDYVSFGSFSDVSPVGGVGVFRDVGVGKWNSFSPSIILRQDASNFITGTINITETGFEITWAFTGTLPSGTGNRRIVYTAFAH